MATFCGVWIGCWFDLRRVACLFSVCFDGGGCLHVLLGFFACSCGFACLLALRLGLHC